VEGGSARAFAHAAVTVSVLEVISAGALANAIAVDDATAGDASDRDDGVSARAADRPGADTGAVRLLPTPVLEP
jgi:hypothetical protein